MQSSPNLERTSFRSVGKPPRVMRSKAVDTNDKSIHRCAGIWQKTKAINRTQSSRLLAMSRILPNLPRWRLADGIDVSKFRPDPHQLIPIDTLSSSWLEFIGHEDKPRTRVLIADEGGTGKTLSAALAVRWATCQPEPKGPVIVLCPPLLKEHWEEHLKAVFNDDPERVRLLSSARFFDPHFHKGDVIVVSKYSWAIHWEEIREKMGPGHGPLCVVVDEAHQGRSSFDGGDERMEGELRSQGQEVTTASLKKAVRDTCNISKYAIGVTATPINTDTDEIVSILEQLGSEQTDSRTIPKGSQPSTKWMTALGKLSSWARGETNEEGACPRKILDPLCEMLRNGSWPKSHWTSVSEDDAIGISSQLLKVALTPSLALTASRELHPFGRHLCMTLRDNLSQETASKFRTRVERALRLRPSDGHLSFLEQVTRSDEKGEEHPGLMPKQKTSTRIVVSHRMNPRYTNPETGTPQYAGDWSPGEEMSWGGVREIEDERIPALISLIEDDLSMSKSEDGRRDSARGCVIFTDFRGSVHWIQDEESGGLPKAIETEGGIVRLEKTDLTGSTDVEEAKRRIKDCKQHSMKEQTYPILICTSAGEVGLDMPWATLLVHWDLHPNPQRMEQRAWRLDRRIRDGEKIARKFSVVHMVMSDVPVYGTLEREVDKRYTKACKALGLKDRKYIPEEGPPIDISQEGSRNKAALVSEPIKQLESFLGGGHAVEWPGKRLKEAERLCMAALLQITGIVDDPRNLLETGEFEFTDPWAEQIHIGSQATSVLRDLESINAPLATNLSPSLSGSKASRKRCVWESPSTEATAIASALTSIKPLFSPVQSEDHTRPIPVVRTSTYKLEEECTVMLNLGIAGKKEQLSLDDPGIRVIGRTTGKQYDPANDKDSWEALFSSVRELLTSGRSEYISPHPPEPDPVGKETTDHRVGVLERRNEHDELHLKSIRALIEEDPEGNARLDQKAVALESHIKQRADEISEVSSIDGKMIPVLIMGGTQ